MEVQALILSLLLLTLVSDSNSRSLETPVQCATTCVEPTNYAFSPDYTYEFQYQATVESSFQTQPDANSKTTLRIDTTVLVDALSKCELVLRLENSRLTTDEDMTDESKDVWIETLEQYPLHFSWQNGKIPDICASNDDPIWVLNIKRGILSTLQVSSSETADGVIETDVTGTCESSYTVQEGRGSTTVNKIKDFNTCKNREKYLLFSYFTSYQSDSPRQNFIYSSQTCQQNTTDGLITISQCAERHTFRPFSSDESGAQTAISQQLRFLRQLIPLSQNTISAANAHHTTLEFESEEDTTNSRDISEIQNFFVELCDKMEDENFVEVGKDFVKFVSLLRRLDASSIGQVNSVLDGVCPRRENALRKMFQDAVQSCPSEGCVVYMARLIASDVDEQLAKQWLNGMNFVTKPTLPMITEVMNIAQNELFMETSYLIAGTMIHRWCESSSGNCLIEPTIRNALSFFEEKLGTNCRTSESGKQEILYALRAIGNAGRTSSIPTIASCAEEETNDMETRVAAIQTFRRMPCNIDRSALSRLLSDIHEDSEIRIGSYMALIKCPNPSLMQQLIILLDDEEVQQVASYIWSNLNEIMHSNDPLKGYMKPLLMETQFAKKHDLDPRKFSRYYEASVFSEKLNAGATVESSIIWSSKSFVPRSADLGLSVDLFGQAVNLFEVGGRVEGVEQLVQSTLGSDNFFKQNPLSKLLMGNDDDDEDEDDDEVDDESESRSLRSTDKHEISRLHEQFQPKLNTENSPNGNFYLRLFGNEIMYGNSRGMKNNLLLTHLPILQKIIQDGRYEYHDNIMFLNSAHTLPTGAGLPLSISFNGSASVDVNVNGNMDLSKMFHSPAILSVNGALEPRATVVVTGTMTVDAHATKIGIATESSALTSMNLGATVSWHSGENFNVNVSAPYNKNTLFKFNHKLLKVIGENKDTIGNSQTNTAPECLTPYASQRICVEKPRILDVFPVDGPISASVYLQKTNPSIQFYSLSGSYDSNRFPEALNVSLILDVNGPEQIRSLGFVYNLKEKRFNLNFNGPEDHIEFTGNMTNEPTQKSLSIFYTRNGEQTRLQTVFQFQHHDQEKVWTANTELVTPQETITGSAKASLDPYKSISASLNITNLLDQPLRWNVTLQDLSKNNRVNYRGEAYLAIPGRINTGGNFELKLQPKSDNFRFRLDYSFNDIGQQSIVFLHKRRNQTTDRMVKWFAEQKLTVTQYPTLNHELELSYMHNQDSVESLVKFEYGELAGLEHNSKFISVYETLSYESMLPRNEVHAQFAIKMPPLQISYEGGIHYFRDGNTFNTSVSVQNYEVNLLIQSISEENERMNKSFRLAIPTPWGDLVLNERLEEVTENMYTITGKLGLGLSQGLSWSTVCTIENSENRKSLVVTAEGNERTLLDGSFILQLNEPGGFELSNKLESTFNNLIVLNLRHQKTNENEQEFELLFQHDPDKYFNGNLSLSKMFRGKGGAGLSLDFKDSKGVMHKMNLQVNITDVAIFSNVTILFEIDSSLIHFNNVGLSAQFETSDLDEVNIGVWYKKNDVEVVGIDTKFFKFANSTKNFYKLTFEGRQSICSQYNLIKFTSNVDWSPSREYTAAANLTVDSIDKLLIHLAIDGERLTAQGTINQDFASLPLPREISVNVTLANDGPSIIRLTYFKPEGYKEIKITGELRNNLTLELIHNDMELHIPTPIHATLDWGYKTSSNQFGIWFSSIVSNDAFNANIFFSNAENRKALEFHVLNEVGISAVKMNGEVYFERQIGNVTTGVSLTSNDKVQASILLQWCESGAKFQAFHHYDFKPDNVRMEFTLQVNSLKNALGHALFEYDTSKTELSLHTGEKEKLFELSYYSNVSYISGNFSLSIGQFTKGFKLLLESDNASADLFFLPRELVLSYFLEENSALIHVKYDDNDFQLESDYNSNIRAVRFILSTSGPLVTTLNLPKTYDVGFELNQKNLIIDVNLDDELFTGEILFRGKSFFAEVRNDESYFADFPALISINSTYNFIFVDYLKLTFNGKLTVNEQIYNVNFMHRSELVEMSLFSNSIYIPYQMSTMIRHDIEALSLLGIPLEISLENVLFWEMNTISTFSFNNKIRQTKYHQELRRAVNTTNNLNFSINFDITNYELVMKLSHDCAIPENIPRYIKFDIRLSRPNEQSGVTYKALRFGLQRDNVREAANITAFINKATEDKSMLFMFQHNATYLYDFGIAKEMSINMKGVNIFNFEIEIDYDTLNKSVGFNFDYHADRRDKKMLNVLFYHNFDSVVNQFMIPKKFGFKFTFPKIDSYDALKSLDAYEIDLVTYFGKRTNHAHIDAEKEILKSYSNSIHTFLCNYKQNFTAYKGFPKEARLYVSMKNIPGKSNLDAKFTIGNMFSEKFFTFNLQTVNTNIFNDESKIILGMFDGVISGMRFDLSMDSTYSLDATLINGSKKLLEVAATPKLNSKSIDITIKQKLTEKLVKSLSVGGNYSNTEANGYFKIKTDSNGVLSANFNWNGESRQINLSLFNVNNNWATNLPNRIHLNTLYSWNINRKIGEFSISNRITINEISNIVELETRFVGEPWNMMFSDITLTHNFNGYHLIPLRSNFNVLYELAESSLTIQANATLGDTSYRHGFELTFFENSEMSAGVQLILDNEYLNSRNVPHTVAFSASLSLEDEITAYAKATYGDDRASLQCVVDTSKKNIYFEIKQTWTVSANKLELNISLPYNEDWNFDISIDKVSLNALLAGNLAQHNVHIEFHHTFEKFPARSVVISGHYGIDPDAFVDLTLNIDDQIYRLQGNYEKLDNGFRITTLLPDNLSRDISFESVLSTGRVFFTIDHNIPELSEYIPRNLSFDGRIATSPLLNLTASLQRDSETRMFTTSLDTTSLKFNFSHNLDEVPIPHSIVVELINSSSPLTYGISVTIDGINRAANISIDPSNRQSRFTHSIPEFDSWFIGRDVIIGAKVNPDTLGGEVYISVDGVERRIGGSVNRKLGLYKLFHNTPQLVKYVPRNITLQLKGNLWPLNGSITLTMDEVERSVDAVFRPRDLFALTNIRVPEFKSILPEHLAISAGFNSTSGHVEFSFVHNNRNQSLFTNYKFGEKLRLEIEQNLALLKKLPDSLVIEVSIENLCGNINVTLNEKLYFHLNGAVQVNEDGWYGVSFSGRHNYKKWKKRHNLPFSSQFLVKGKMEAISFHGQAIVNLIEHHFYNGTVKISPKMNSIKKAVFASYAHSYQERTRNVSCSVSFSLSESTYKLELVGSQHQPQIFNFKSEIEILLDKPSVNIVILESGLNELGIPETISFSAEMNSTEISKHWQFNFTIAGDPCTIGIDFTFNKENPLDIAVGITFENLISLLLKYDLPKHASARFSVKESQDSTKYELRESLRFEYNEEHLQYNASWLTKDMSYYDTLVIDTNSQKISDWFGFSNFELQNYEMVDSYALLTGNVTVDHEEIAAYTIKLDMEAKEFTCNCSYHNNGYNVSFKNNITEKEKGFLLSAYYNDSTLFKFGIEKNDSSGKFEIENHLLGKDFEITSFGFKEEFFFTGHLNVTFSEEYINNSLLLDIQPYESKNRNGERLVLKYSGLTILDAKYAFSEHYRSCLFDLEWSGEENCSLEFSITEESAHVSGKYNDMIMDYRLISNDNEFTRFRQTLKYRNIAYLQSKGIPDRISSLYERSDENVITISVTGNRQILLDLLASTTELNLEVNSPNGISLINIIANVTLHPVKTINFSWSGAVFQKNGRLNGNFIMFDHHSGNSTIYIDFKLGESEFYLSGYAGPTPDYTPLDFDAKLKIISTFEQFMFNIDLSANSNDDNNVYISDFIAGFDNQTFGFHVNCKRTLCQINFTQSLYDSVPITSFNYIKTTDREDYETVEAKVLWGNDADQKIMFLGKAKNNDLSYIYAAHFMQPFEFMYITDLHSRVHLDLNTAATYSFGVNAAVNEYENGFNATYKGELPLLIGSHKLDVNISQSIVSAIPSQFRTTGVVNVSSLEYHSSWSIISDEKNLATLNKTLILREHIEFALLWKQAHFNIPFSFIKVNMSHDLQNGGAAEIQIDGMPKLAFSYQLLQSDSNTSMSFDINSGPLSKWIKFNTFHLSSLYYSEYSARGHDKDIGLYFEIDGNSHQFKAMSKNITTENGARFRSNIQLSHPYDVKLFGITMPKNVTLNGDLKQKKRSRLVLTYDEEGVFGIKVTTSLNNVEKMIKIETVLNYRQEEEKQIHIDLIVTNSSINTNFHWPEERISSQSILTYKNIAEIFEVKYSANYFDNVEPIKIWKGEFKFEKSSQVITVTFSTPTTNRTTLTGNVREILAQAKAIVTAIISKSSSSSLKFIKGIKQTDSGSDFYIGYSTADNTKYTLHMSVSSLTNVKIIALQVKKNFELQAEIARVTIKIISGEMVQLKSTANPVLVDFVRTTIDDINNDAKDKINFIASQIIGFLDSLKGSVTDNEAMQQMFNDRIDEIINKVNYARISAIQVANIIASDSTNRFALAELATENGVRKAIEKLLKMVENGREIVLLPFSEVYDRYVGSVINQINITVARQLQPATVILQKVNAGQLLIELVNEAIHNSIDYIITNGEAIFIIARGSLSDLLWVDSTTVIFNIPVALKVDEIQNLPSLEQIKLWFARSAFAASVNDAVEKIYSYTDDYYRARALVYIPRQEILPPFKGHAFVSGFHHFSTFDKKHFDFSSDCASSYVLASDMRDNNFTILVNYHDPSDRNAFNAIEIVVENSHVIVSEDYTVRLHGKVKELPLVLDSVSVVLEGNTVHVRRTEGDLDVACDFTKSLCTVDMSPYYFGATAGLAGIYNNEPMDDFTSPRHRILDTPTQLAREWQSSKRCFSRNAYQNCNRESTQCHELFNSINSPLRACFPLVDPKPFMAMCQDDVCINTERMCNSIHAYAYRCGLVGAKVDLPAECVTCTTTDENTVFNVTVSRSERITAADVVLVVEQGNCMHDNPHITKTLKKFLKKFESELKRSNIRDIRYQLVGYGGIGASAVPNTITLGTKSFATNKKLITKSLKNIPISTEQIHSDTLSAIYYASQLSFRAGAKPMIIALPCDTCYDSELSYSDVEWHIRKRGILLHYIPKQKLNTSSNAKTIYGFDAAHAYSKVKYINRSILKPNKNDMCQPLAAETGGSVWDRNYLPNTDFVNKLTNYIGEQMIRGQRIRCTCEMNEAGVPSPVCLAL